MKGLRYLAMADADRVQEYVFAPPQLRYVRGASRLQTEAIQQIHDVYTANEVLYANGGVVLAEFDRPGKAEAFCSLAEEKFGELTATATVATAVVEYDGQDFSRGWKHVREAVEFAKRQRNAARPMGPHWLWANCERCGERAASVLVAEPDAVRSVCTTCNLKYQSGGQQGGIAGFQPVWTFEKLAELSRPQGYLALVYLDLDRLGRYLEDHVSSRDECRQISKAIDETLIRSVQEAGRRAAARPVPHRPNKEGEKPQQPFLELLVGGDDAIVMMASDLALPFLRFFEEEFRFETALPRRPNFSAGIVFAHHQLPIGDFVRTAKHLCTTAKRIKERDAVAFQLVTSSMPDDPESAGKPTANPYELPKFLDLAKNLEELKQAKMPRSKIHALYEAAWKERLQGQLEYLNLLIRTPSRPRDILRRTVGSELWERHPDGNQLTVAADLAELWEFVDVE